MILHKNGLIRDIPVARIREYMTAGWHSEPVKAVAPIEVIEAEEVINLKPPARVKAAVKSADDNNAITQGEQ